MSLETFDQLSPEEKVESMYQEIQSLNYKWETTTNLLIKKIENLETYIHGPTRKPFDE